MGLGTETAFVIFGSIIVIGYFGELFSKRFQIPSALLLLLIGYLLKLSGYVDTAALEGIQPLFSTLALIVLLFDGSLSLNIYDTLFKSGRILLQSVVITILSMIIGAFIMHMVGFDMLVGAIMGAIAGGIGSTTTISVARGLNLPNEITRFLTVESSMTDVFSIILTIVLTQNIISGYLDVQLIGQGILANFSIGAMFGIVTGLFFLSLLWKVEQGYTYMMTLALVLIAYACAEFFGGSGAISVLIFGVIMGNEQIIRKTLRIHIKRQRLSIKQFHTEISFIIRTFFFVFLGIIVNLLSFNNFLIALALVIGFLLVRFVSVYFITRGTSLFTYRKVLTAISPRGLATAVLATYPLTTFNNYLAETQELTINGFYQEFVALPEIAFYIIVITIVLTTILVPLTLNGPKNKEEELKEETRKKRKE